MIQQKVRFIVGGEAVHDCVLRSDDVPRRGDSVRLPGERRMNLVIRPVYIYGKSGLLRIEVHLSRGTRR